MYVPHFTAVDDDTEVRRMVASVGSAQLVTTGDAGYPLATLLPIIWIGDTVIAHMARANPHWAQIGDGAPVLLIVEGPQAYVSPSWYPSKAAHGRVVPTWNYTGVQLLGRARVDHDPAWLRRAVDELTTRHESSRDHPWATTDAPDKYVSGQLRAIVGIEIAVERVFGKAKLSQNRSAADQQGVIAGLREEAAAGAAFVAAEMEHSRPEVERVGSREAH